MRNMASAISVNNIVYYTRAGRVFRQNRVTGEKTGYKLTAADMAEVNAFEVDAYNALATWEFLESIYQHYEQF